MQPQSGRRDAGSAFGPSRGPSLTSVIGRRSARGFDACRQGRYRGHWHGGHAEDSMGAGSPERPLSLWTLRTVSPLRSAQARQSASCRSIAVLPSRSRDRRRHRSPIVSWRTHSACRRVRCPVVYCQTSRITMRLRRPAGLGLSPPVLSQPPSPVSSGARTHARAVMPRPASRGATRVPAPGAMIAGHSRRSRRTGNSARVFATAAGSISTVRISSPGPASASTAPHGSITRLWPASSTPESVPEPPQART